MRMALAIIGILICAAGSADARRHHRYHLRYYDAVSPTQTEIRPYAPRRSALPSPEERLQGSPRVVPSDWREETADAQRGQRFVSPDGSASFIAYAVPAGEEGVAAHMKAVAFGDGEQITYLRGERSWIEVGGFKQGRIFYRAAVLACAGDRWHHIAFDYPASAKAEMRAFVERASAAVLKSENSACDIPVISNW